MSEPCKVCGFRHSNLYEQDAKKLVAGLLNMKYELRLKFLGGGVNNLGAQILLKHALKILEELP